MELIIDTSDAKRVRVALVDGGKRREREVTAARWNAQMVLPLLEELLQESGKSFRDITSVTVNPGPGSYTGLRVGCAIANTIGWVLRVPVNGVSGVTMPSYEES